jgi:hypothetical protein
MGRAYLLIANIMLRVLMIAETLNLIKEQFIGWLLILLEKLAE